MKFIVPFLLLHLLFFHCAFSQTIIIEGKVADSKTNLPLAYVNIGIPGKAIGTVSDPDGNFSLRIQEENENDSLKFSRIGFESKNFIIKDLKGNSNTILLSDKAYQLNEVIIAGKRAHTDTIGSRKITPKAHYYFTPRAIGGEMGRAIKLKKTPAQIQTLTFNVKKADFDSVTFRVNIYNIIKKQPGNNLLAQNIIFTTAAKQGEVTVDLSQYNITVYKDFIITLETLQIFGEIKEKSVFYFSAEIPGEGFGKLASQDKWRKLKIVSIFFKIGVKYI